MLTAIVNLCHRRRRLVVTSWVLGLLVLVVLAAVAAGSTSDDYTVPDSGSQHALDLLRAHGLNDDETGSFQVVFADPDGLRSSPGRAAVGKILDQVGQRLSNAEVAGPFESADSHQVSPDGTIAYAQVQVPIGPGGSLSDAQLGKIQDLPEQIHSPAGVDVAFAGPMFQTTAGGGPGEGVGILIAAVILFLGFGSVLAMGLPLMVAGFGAGCGVTAVMLVANVVGMSSAAVPLAAMLAVGVGIDYSLFVVTRYRESLAEGLEPGDAITRSQGTAGRSVLFAGSTVVIAVLGLLVMGMPLIDGVAIGAALAIAITMAAALTLLPALLGFAGTNIARLGLPHRHQRAAGDGRLARRWSRSVQRHPWPYAIGALLVLAVLTVPAFSMRLGFTDAGVLPQTNTARQAYDMLADGFGPGVNGPLFAVVDDAHGPVTDATLTQLRGHLATTSGVATVSTPVHSRDGAIGMLIITPTTGPSDAATAQLASHLSHDVVPDALHKVDPTAHGYLTGSTAAAADFSAYTAHRLPAFLAVIMALAFCLLTIVFRALVIATKAIIVNLLSIGASFGVVVAAVQWGWGSGLFGLDQSIPVVAWVPMMMVALVFGLSMDYEVFLLSRIKEHHDHGEPNAIAVATGLGGTARVITVAAAIMICVFASFILGGDIDLAVFGFGLAAAVLIDASLVRMILVPAVMELLGEHNWWLPDWLSRRLPPLPGDNRHTASNPAAPEQAR